MWWLYFSYAARVAERRLELAENRVPLARDAYTYLHVLLAAGVIVSAVGDELAIAHPSEHLPTAELLVVAGGPALYLLGLALFRLRMAGSIATKRVVAATVCLVLIPLGHQVSALVFGTLMLVVLVVLILAEDMAGRHYGARGEPTPLERLNAETDAGLRLVLVGRVAVVEHQRVAVGVGEERHVADAGVHRVPEERHAIGLEL